MPPIWLIAGLVTSLAIAYAADFVVLRPRSRVVIVDGRPKHMRRVRDTSLLLAAMMVMFIAVLAIGYAIEGDLSLLAFGTAVFGGVMIYAVWRGLRGPDWPLPEAPEVRTTAETRANTRRIVALVGLAVLALATNSVSSVTDGGVAMVFSLTTWASYLVTFWLLWRIWRGYRSSN